MDYIQPNETGKQLKNHVHSESNWYDIISSPVSYFLLVLIRSKNKQSLDYLQANVPPKYMDLFKKILNFLEDHEHIAIDNGDIILKNHDFLRNNSGASLDTFLPEVNQMATKIAIRKGDSGKRGNSVRYYTFTKNKRNSEIIREATLKYYQVLESLSTNDTGDSDEPASKQYVSITTAEITLEDLV